MQTRSSRPAPRGALRPSAALLLLSMLAVGAASGAGSLGDPQLQGLLQRAARAALHFFNYRSGSPSALRVLGAVQEGRAQVSAEDTLVDVTFAAERFHLEQGPPQSGRCRAQVWFTPHRPRAGVNVTCARLMAQGRRQQEDQRLFRLLRNLPALPANITIPDSHGHMDPSLRPLWDLVFLGSSFVMWEQTTQASRYALAQLRGVQQWKTSNDAIYLDYTVLLHEFTTQEMLPCRIRLAWYPGKPLRVKYHCWELQTPEEASGEGTAGAL